MFNDDLCVFCMYELLCFVLKVYGDFDSYWEVVK